MSAKPSLVLAIDPGSSACGVALARGDAFIEARLVSIPDRRDHPCPVAGRLMALNGAVDAVVHEFIRAHGRPDAIAAERPFARGIRSDAVIAAAWGVALSAAYAACAPVVPRFVDLSPATIKAAVTGHGGATKDRVRAAVVALTGLPADVPEDVADAAAAALTAGRRLAARDALAAAGLVTLSGRKELDEQTAARLVAAAGARRSRRGGRRRKSP